MTRAAPTAKPQTTEEIQREWLQSEFPYLNLTCLERVFDEFNIPTERCSDLADNLNDARAEYEIHRKLISVPVPSAVRKFLLDSIHTSAYSIRTTTTSVRWSST